LRVYASKIETIHYYGYEVWTDKTEERTFIGDSSIRIRKLTAKKLPLLAHIEEKVEEEYYCLLGFSKYGTFILSKYENNQCVLEKDICSWLKEDGTKPEFDVNTYCQ